MPSLKTMDKTQLIGTKKLLTLFLIFTLINEVLFSDVFLKRTFYINLKHSK